MRNALEAMQAVEDRFQQLRERRKWDLYAERYAAAVTLYEMATGTLS